MEMHNPPHPGEVLLGLYMEPVGLSITEVSKNIGVDRKTLSRLINGHTSVSAEMAIRLSKAFNTTEEIWLRLQQSYDLWQVKKQKRVDLSSIKTFDFENQVYV